ncbi:hypothetical protein [Chamaesiphon sp. OTE_8_metabat_110]|uniref:hypothetical protein n=1 Tax=Chamaesiphon sp. OTE_8_metabat_110 TaxID=2964696 RepID=UPI00286CE1F9|nr:hypothetical protein [Chamaesiphon sp. OTE_8_metabat_110]
MTLPRELESQGGFIQATKKQHQPVEHTSSELVGSKCQHGHTNAIVQVRMPSSVRVPRAMAAALSRDVGGRLSQFLIQFM